MTSFMALDGVTSFLRLKDVTITCKRMRHSLSIGGSSSLQWRKVGRSWRLRMCFRRLLYVRIEIDQLLCVNCWVIIHSLEVSCKEDQITSAQREWFIFVHLTDRTTDWPPNSELLLNNSLLELIYFLIRRAYICCTFWNNTAFVDLDYRHGLEKRPFILIFFQWNFPPM